MNDIVLWLCVIVPVVCMTLVCLALGFLFWRMFARLESQMRDLIKSVLAMADRPAANQIAAMMETNDGAAAKAAATPALGQQAMRRVGG